MEMSEQIRLRRCPLCGNGSALKIVCEGVIPSGHKRKWPENWQVSLESTRLVKCNTCGFCYVWEDIPEELLFLLFEGPVLALYKERPSAGRRLLRRVPFLHSAGSSLEGDRG